MMKRKFEANVAICMPKIKGAYEPRLPWEISKYDLGQIALSENTAQSFVGKKVLETRPIFLVVLLVFVFAAILYMFLHVAGEGEKARLDIQKNKKAALALQSELKKTINEKGALKEKAASLQEDVNNLKNQNGIFVMVIENLSRKNRTPVVDQQAGKRTRFRYR